MEHDAANLNPSGSQTSGAAIRHDDLRGTRALIGAMPSEGLYDSVRRAMIGDAP